MAHGESLKHARSRDYFSLESFLDWLAPLVVVIVIGGMIFALVGAMLASVEQRRKRGRVGSAALRWCVDVLGSIYPICSSLADLIAGYSLPASFPVQWHEGGGLNHLALLISTVIGMSFAEHAMPATVQDIESRIPFPGLVR